MVVFWGGLAEPFKSRMSYWVPEELLEDYINLALNLSGSAFRVELAAEPAPFREPTQSAPEPAPFREATQSAPEPAPVREPTQSAPEPAPVREPTQSAPEPAPVREHTDSAPEPAPGAHAVHSGPGPRSSLGTHRACSRASPTLAPLCAHCSRPSSTPRAWPTSLLDIFLFSVCGASGIHSLKGGGGYVTVLLVCPGWPPDVSVC